MAQVHAILAVAAAISEVRIQVQGDPDDPRY
jgi:translation initiation factor 1 (eIF-1/SUI1)